MEEKCYFLEVTFLYLALDYNIILKKANCEILQEDQQTQHLL